MRRSPREVHDAAAHDLGRPRTPTARGRSRWTFKASWSDTLDLLERELRHLDARDVALEADFREPDLRLDGMPRSNARQPVDPGVRIAFDSRHGALVYAADTCEFWQHNVRSIALGLEALRAVDRYGISRRAEQYRGYRQIGGASAIVPDAPLDREAAALVLAGAAYPDPDPESVARDAREVLTGRLDLDAVGRRARRHTHPDTGGSTEAFQRVEAALRVLRGSR
ncbi:hypothetical protein [Cellulomonas olei]|uniref:hypothetical protein n=1 Tax=Cellulomonas sp. P4 TaxID=3142533 RepID=UPI0031BBADDC